MHAKQITAPLAHHGEGPVWITGCGWPEGLYWVDMLAGDVLHVGDEGAVTRRHLAAVAAVIRPRAGTGMVYAIERGFALDDGPGTPLRRLPDLWTDPTVRMNEGGCDPAGNLYCGSMANSAAPGEGSLYRLEPDGNAALVEAGLTIPNGLDWSPSGSRAYHNDTVTGHIEMLDWNAEVGLRNRRRFATVTGGGPDGLTVDSEGGVWVAVWGADAVHRYTPEGKLSAVVEVPVAQVSACTFGGAALDQLFITTSREGLSAPETDAGALFVVDAGVRGMPCRKFAG